MPLTPVPRSEDTLESRAFTRALEAASACEHVRGYADIRDMTMVALGDAYGLLRAYAADPATHPYRVERSREGANAYLARNRP